MKTIRNVLLAIIAGIPVFTSCSGERLDPADKSREIIFSVSVPGNSSPTRALGDVEESEVVSIEMLLFDPVSKTVVHNPVFANAITSDPNGNGDFRKKSFSVRLPTGTYDIMIFANSRAAFNSIIIQADEEQETILAKLTASMPATGWVTDPTDAAKNYLIPMWGMKENVDVGEGKSISDIHLHRMLSRIDVRVTGLDAQTGNFKIKDIKLYNVQKEGRSARIGQLEQERNC